MSDFDELLQPTVQNAPVRPRAKPWRLQSQFWVAFLGGALPYAVIAFINAQRLGLETKKRWWMAIATAAALGVLVVLWLQRPVSADFVTFARGTRDTRLYSRITAVVLYLIVSQIQKPADAHYRVFGDDYESLWVAGIGATIIVGATQNAVLAWIRWILGV